MCDSNGVEVNGKIDLGTRKLVVSHVENAATFYAYLEAEKQFMSDIKQMCKEKCQQLDRLAMSPSMDQNVGVFHNYDKCWYRGKVEQLNQGKGKNLTRVRIVDFGWNSLFKLSDLTLLPDSLAEKKILCEKYKMNDLKPKGRMEGYTADDRQHGADWLKRTINGRVVICSCHKQVNYAGGLMADCMVGDLNLNKAALKQGHVILAPAIMGNLQANAGNRSTPNNMHFNHNPFLSSPFQTGMQYSSASAEKNVDVDYSSYNGKPTYSVSSRLRNGQGSHPRPQSMPMSGKTLEVKKLEKKISADKKTINELKKTTNLDAGVREISRLLDKVNQARGNDPEREAKGNYILTSLAGVAEVIEESSVVTERYLAGIEAVEAAARRVSDEEKAAVQDPHDNSIQSKSDLHKCITAFLEMYNEQVVEDELYRINSQLTTMIPNIPSGWKLLAVKAEVVTRPNLLEVAESIKQWMEESVSREAALAANSKKEVESLCRSLDLLSKSILEKHEGNVKTDIPKSLDSQLGSTRQALQSEVSGRNGVKLTTDKKGKSKSGTNDALVLKSAWKALTALKNQLEISKKKSIEYESMLTTLQTIMA